MLTVGKNTFLIWLLLHRLQQKLPTAIQFQLGTFLYFDENGPRELSADSSCRSLLRNCWALSAESEDIARPCFAFSLSEAVNIHVAPAWSDRWRSWKKHHYADIIFMDIPRTREVAALVYVIPLLFSHTGIPIHRPLALRQELELDVALAVSLVHKWGPCTQTIVDLLLSPFKIDRREVLVSNTARDICLSPSTTLCGGDKFPTASALSLFFIRPLREPEQQWAFSTHALLIPTLYLNVIFQKIRAQVLNSNSRVISEAFQRLTWQRWKRTINSRLHEARTHVYMSSTAPSLALFNEQHQRRSEITPTTMLLPGTLTALKHVEDYSTFYWFPSVDDFGGIDGVLKNDTNIYLLQAAVAGEDRDPVSGIRRVWEEIDPSTHACNWHIVVVADAGGETLAAQYAMQLDSALKSFKLGNGGDTMQVWGSVLETSQLWE